MPEGSWVAACKIDDVDLEDVVPFENEGTNYAIYRSADDEFYATAGHCTHERELLCNGLVMDNIIECPKHNGRFDYATGKARGAPAIDDLLTYAVKVDNDTVYLRIG